LGWTLGRLASSLLASGPSLPAQQRKYLEQRNNEYIVICKKPKLLRKLEKYFHKHLAKTKKLFDEKYFENIL
jgi:hypothetical protein